MSSKISTWEMIKDIMENHNLQFKNQYGEIVGIGEGQSNRGCITSNIFYKNQNTSSRYELNINDVWEVYRPFHKFDKVKITKGLLKGFKGKIIDIDINDNEKPLSVEMHNRDFDGNYYCHYDEVVLNY